MKSMSKTHASLPHVDRTSPVTVASPLRSPIDPGPRTRGEKSNVDKKALQALGFFIMRDLPLLTK